MRVPGWPRGNGAAHLGLALLAALLLHALWLAEAQLRQSRQPPPARLQRADDTPELLVFSRQPPEPLGLDTVPLPPPEAMPPPPPSLPGLRGGPRQAGPPTLQAGSPARPTGKRPSGPSPKPSRTTSRLAAGGAGQRRPAPPPLPPLPATSPLEALREARRRGPDAGPSPLEGEALQAWRTLWQSAEAGSPPPAALTARPVEAEVRRLPLARARAEGVDPVSGLPLRFDDQWLLPWIDGEQLWLLRVPG